MNENVLEDQLKFVSVPSAVFLHYTMHRIHRVVHRVAIYLYCGNFEC